MKGFDPREEHLLELVDVVSPSARVFLLREGEASLVVYPAFLVVDHHHPLRVRGGQDREHRGDTLWDHRQDNLGYEVVLCEYYYYYCCCWYYYYHY